VRNAEGVDSNPPTTGLSKSWTTYLGSHSHRSGGERRSSRGTHCSTAGLHALHDLLLLLLLLERLLAQLALNRLLEGFALAQSQLSVGPDRLVVLLGTLDADADEAAEGLPVAGALDAQLPPDGVQRPNEVVAVLLRVARSGSHPQALLAPRHGWVVDRLDIDAVVLQQHVGRALGQLRVAHQDGDDVRRVRDHGDVDLLQRSLDRAGVQLLQHAVTAVPRLILDGSGGAGHDRRGQRRGEDETRGQGPDGIDHGGRPGDVASDEAVGLAQGTGDDVNAVHDRAFGAAGVGGIQGSVDVIVEMLGHTGTVGTVHADRVHFVQERDGAVFVREIADLLDGRNGPAHAVDRLERDDLRDVERQRRQLGLKILEVVVLEHHLLGARVPDALDHRGMVQAVGQDHAVGHLAAQRGERGIVGDVAGAEDQSGLLAVQPGDGVLKSDRMLVVAGDVAGASRPGTVIVQRAVHGLQHLRIAAHAEIVVGAPHRHTLLRRGRVGAGELLRKTVDVVEVAVRLVLVLLLQLAAVEAFVVEAGGRGGMGAGTREGFRALGRRVLHGVLDLGEAGVDYIRSSSAVGCDVESSMAARGKHTVGVHLLIRPGVDAGALGAGGVVSPLAVRLLEGAHGAHAGHAGRGGGEALGTGETGALDGQGLAHDGAAAGDELEVGDGAAAGAGAGGRREGAQCRGRGALEERAHGPGLAEERLHGDAITLRAILATRLGSGMGVAGGMASLQSSESQRQRRARERKAGRNSRITYSRRDQRDRAPVWSGLAAARRLHDGAKRKQTEGRVCRV